MDNVSLEIQGLSKRFILHIRDGLQVDALHDFSLRTRRGEFTGLVGHSGSGKSTLLKCLFRTYLPDSGTAAYTDESGQRTDLAAADEHTILRLRASGLGYVSQTLRVIPRVTVERTVGRPLAGRGLDRDEVLRKARFLLERLNLPQNLWDSYPALLSGGEQQRVNVAKALISEPNLLLLDEPTSALDSNNQAAVVELLEERLDGGATMIGAFHDAPSLQRLASSVIRLERGRVTQFEDRREAVLAGSSNVE